VARIANVNVPDNKKLVYSLTYIYGIGLTTSESVCKDSGVAIDKKVKDLTEGELASLRDVIEKNHTVEGDLRKEIQMNIKRKKDIKCYQGRRHVARLPVRGQNTNTNAKTRKGKSIPIAGKKK
jgi:small subunit ribosomal protein S13